MSNKRFSGDSFKLQFQNNEIEVIPVSVITLALKRKYTSAIVTWLKLKSLLRFDYGSVHINKLKFISNILNLNYQVFKKHLKILFDLNLLRYAQDNLNLIQIVSQHKKGCATSVGVIDTETLFSISKLNKEFTYKHFRALLTEILIDLDIRKKISKRKSYKKTYGKDSNKYASLNKWTRDCRKDSTPIATAYVSLLNNMSKSTTASYRNIISNILNINYSNRTRSVRGVCARMVHQINDCEKDALNHDEIKTSNYGYCFVNKDRQVVKRFIAIRKSKSILIKRHCNNICNAK
jgi:hypothetical protein